MKSRPLTTKFSSVQRSKERSATGKLAYVCGVKIVDERTGVVRDFRRRAGVVSTMTVGFPGTIPELGNRCELAEVRSDAVVGYELLAEIPHEISLGAKLEMAARTAVFIHEQTGGAVAVPVHEPPALARRAIAAKRGISDTRSFGDERNWHMHPFVTSREVDPKTGAFGKKIRWMSQKKDMSEFAHDYRVFIANLANELLKREGHVAAANYDPRSFAEQGIERVPTLHEGPSCAAQRRRGKSTPVSTVNDTIRETNRALDDLAARQTQLTQEQNAYERAIGSITSSTWSIFDARLREREREATQRADAERRRNREAELRKQQAVGGEQTAASGQGVISSKTAADRAATDRLASSRNDAAARTRDVIREAKRLLGLAQEAVVNAVPNMTREDYWEMLRQLLIATTNVEKLTKAGNPDSWCVVRVGRELRAHMVASALGKPIVRVLRFQSDNDDDAARVKQSAAAQWEKAKCYDQDALFEFVCHERKLAQPVVTQKLVQETQVTLRDVLPDSARSRVR